MLQYYTAYLNENASANRLNLNSSNFPPFFHLKLSILFSLNEHKEKKKLMSVKRVIFISAIRGKT